MTQSRGIDGTIIIDKQKKLLLNSCPLSGLFHLPVEVLKKYENVQKIFCDPL